MGESISRSVTRLMRQLLTGTDSKIHGRQLGSLYLLFRRLVGARLCRAESEQAGIG